MLRIAKPEEINKYMDFCYALSQDFSRSSFPSYKDGIKTKSDFEKVAKNSIADEHSEILLFEQEEVLGWIHYYWLPQDLYLGFETFIIKKNAADAIDEFISYAKKRFAGYQISFGFPAENIEAISHLEKLGFEKTEESDVFVLHFENYELIAEDGNISEVTELNRSDFKKLHDEVEGVYWNSERLFYALEDKTSSRWKMYLYYKDGEALANIYFVYTEMLMEIFGIDFLGGVFNEKLMKSLLIRALNQSKTDGQRHMTYFTSGKESEIAREMGLEFVTEYKLFQGTL